jgi:hypothetical protein
MAFYEMRKQAVLSQWLQQYVWIILPVLAIPLAILLGARRTNGAIIISGAVAILAIAFQGYRTATIPFDMNTGGYNTLDAIVSQLGGVLSLAAWTLALAHAAQARRWGWFALIVVANFLSYAVQFISNALPYLICSSNPPIDGDISACMTSHQALLTLITLGEAIGPIATLIYILHAPGRRQRQLPEGLVVSSLRDKTRPGEDVISAD